MNVKENRCLNKILQGEHMAIDVYDQYIWNLADSELKEKLLDLRQDHILHAMRLTHFIENHGGRPIDNTGWAGWMTRWMARVNTWRFRQPAEILQVLCSGEDKGLARAEQITKDDLSPTKRQALADYFQDEHDHLARVNHLLQSYLH